MHHDLYRSALLGMAAAWVLTIAGCARHVEVDDAALRDADSDSANWITYGRTYSEQRFSPLKEIDEQSVNRLGLAWSMDFPTLRAYEATPLVRDGVMYTTGAWSVVYAVDARTGAPKWTYDPQVAKDHAKFVCCDVVNRGVALYKGRVYVAALDGRLIALDARTGAVAWEEQTTRVARSKLPTAVSRSSVFESKGKRNSCRTQGVRDPTVCGAALESRPRPRRHCWRDATDPCTWGG